MNLRQSLAALVGTVTLTTTFLPARPAFAQSSSNVMAYTQLTNPTTLTSPPLPEPLPKGKVNGNHATARTAETMSYYPVLRDRDHLVLAQERSLVKVDLPEAIRLEHGQLLVMSKSKLKVGTPSGDILVSAGAAVLIGATAKDLRVADLCDFRSGSVQVLSCNRLLTLRSGIEALFTAELPSLARIFNIPGVGNRYLTSRELDDALWLTTRELCLPDHLKAEPFLKSVRAGGLSQAEKQLIASITKTAAAVQVALRGRPGFQRPRTVTAVALSNRLPAPANASASSNQLSSPASIQQLRNDHEKLTN